MFIQYDALNNKQHFAKYVISKIKAQLNDTIKNTSSEAVFCITSILLKNRFYCNDKNISFKINIIYNKKHKNYFYKITEITSGKYLNFGNISSKKFLFEHMQSKLDILKNQNF